MLERDACKSWQLLPRHTLCSRGGANRGCSMVFADSRALIHAGHQPSWLDSHGCAAAVIDQASRRTLFTLCVPQRTAAYRVLRPTWWHQSSLVCCRAHASPMLDNPWRLRGILAQWDCAAYSPLYCVKLMGHALIVPCDVAATCSLLSLHVWIVHHHGAWMIHATSYLDLG